MKTIPYPSVDTAALRGLMAAAGAMHEWDWYDYLSPGDTVRVVRLHEIARDLRAPASVAQAAALALAEIRRVAQERMAAAPATRAEPSDPLAEIRYGGAVLRVIREGEMFSVLLGTDAAMDRHVPSLAEMPTLADLLAIIATRLPSRERYSAPTSREVAPGESVKCVTMVTSSETVLLPSSDDNFGERASAPKPAEIFHVKDERRSTRTAISAGTPRTFVIISNPVNAAGEVVTGGIGRMVFPPQRNGSAFPPGSRFNVAFIEPPTREDVETAHKAALLADMTSIKVVQ